MAREAKTASEINESTAQTTTLQTYNEKKKNFEPIVSFVQKRYWEAHRLAYGDYRYNVRKRLHVMDECLLIDEKFIIQQHLRQNILDSLHLTHPGAAAMLDLSKNIWFPHIQHRIVQMAQNCQQSSEQGNN